MDARPGGAVGRGRGRSRAAANEPPPEERQVTQPIPQAEPGVLPAIRAIDDLSLGVPDTGRGRSRGRGSGRGRGPGQIEGRGPVVDIFAAGEPAPEVSWRTHLEQQAAAGQFADVEEEAPPSPPHRAQVTPPQAESPGTREGDLSPLSVVGTERRADAFSADVSASTSHVSKKEDGPPPPVIRCGEKGEKVTLKTNYLWLKLKDGSKGMVEYHVSFNQVIESTRNRRKIVGQLGEFLGDVRVFDGMTLSLPYILPNDVTTIPTVNPLAEIGSAERDVLVTITFVKVKPLDDPTCIQFFNNLLKRFMKLMKFVELRREYYDLDMVKAYHKHKLEIWPGKSVVAEMQEGGLMVCVSTCNRVLSTDSVFEYFKLVKSDPRCREKFEKFIVGKIVLTRYNNKTYKIDEVAWNQTPLSTFEKKGRNATGESVAKQISYKDYLKQQYGEEIKVDSQPMLISKIPARKNEFRQNPDMSERILALVPETCYTTGLTDDQRSDFRVMTDLAESTRLTPVQRMNGLQDFVKRALGCKEAMQILEEWGLVLEGKIIDVEGRKVDGADLTFVAGGKPVKVAPDFSREATKAVYDPIHVQKYMIICTQKDTGRANDFIREYKSVTKPLGIRVLGTETIVNTKGMRAMDFEKTLKDECDPSKYDFVVVLLPGQNEDIYRAVKTFCVSIRPVPSQCIVTKTLGNERKLRSVVIKIALQINCKLGGALWALKLPPKEKFMFVGIDAAHDPLRKTGSVICLVASLNNECTKYFSRGVKTRTHQELGTESLHTMMNEALDKFRDVNGSFPTQVIVFRDGGSHGQLTTIDDIERSSVKKAIDSCKADIKFTYVVVTKRISQRFFYDRFKRENYENPEPGTVVDKLVTRRYNYDYYVVSQKVGQGTVNPTHFTVLDTNDPIKPDLIHRLSYVTCFMYYNWAGTVRVPAMVQYAHKLSALLIKSVNGNPDPRVATYLYYL